MEMKRNQFPYEVDPKYAITQHEATSTNLVEIPRVTKELACGKCARTMTVSERTVLAYCHECSQGLGVKR